MHETVSPHFIVETWNAIIAPPKTPEPIIQKMAEVLIKMADDPEVIAAMRKLGGSTVKSTPEQFRTQISSGDRAVEAADQGDRGEREEVMPR